MADGVRFVRVNGRVIPIRAKSGAPVNSKKKYPAVKKAGVGAAVVGAAIGAGLAAKFKFGVFGTAGLAALSASSWGNSTFSKKAKGESNIHLSNRVSNWMNSRKKK